ncbi:hypothetical protein PGT21_000144 [Puccinia graminis f. sp. tritici]|uniref:RNase H type-1 domain-containing protein n=1 Tax=Puccinia graminis f. sp. tritici TaxID=56615 RepID=A0A5B0MSK2_PUCGR|nr:hypothetical protein PGT21_000144 [Puccinia graminis f. sp. tritici]
MNFKRNTLPSSNIINIFSNNQATLQVIAKPPRSTSNQAVFIQIFDKLNYLISVHQASISLLWFPAHVGIPENEKVDQLAKEATKGNRQFDLEQQPRSLSNIQQIIRSNFSFNKRKLPITRNQISLSNIPIKIFKSLNHLERDYQNNDGRYRCHLCPQATGTKNWRRHCTSVTHKRNVQRRDEARRLSQPVVNESVTHQGAPRPAEVNDHHNQEDHIGQTDRKLFANR